MIRQLNRTWIETATVGTGTVTLGAAVAGYQSFAAAGAVDGDEIQYSLVDGDNWELGVGVYTAAGTTLTRGPIQSSNGGAAINLSGGATVFSTVLAKQGGGWTFQETVTTTGTSQVLIDVTGKKGVRLIVRSVTTSAVGRPEVRVSPDGGSTIRNGASDYRQLFCTDGTSNVNNASYAGLGANVTAGIHEGIIEFFGLDEATARTTFEQELWTGTTPASTRKGWQNAAEAIDTIVFDASTGTFSTFVVDVWVQA